jgi:hypothetical protein
VLVRVIYSSYLSSKPRLERERFSGGRNDSAVERNKAKLAEARKAFHDLMNDVVFVPTWMKPEFEAAMAAAGVVL